MKNEYSKVQSFFLTGMRIVIGWHFLYEGALKILNSGWTAKGYLLGAQGMFKGLFQWLGSDSMIGIIDPAVIVILIVTGVSLILGVIPKIASIGGMIMLAFFYFAQPPFPGIIAAGPTEGNYLFVNKNLIELFALGVLYAFPTNELYSLSGIINKKNHKI